MRFTVIAAAALLALGAAAAPTDEDAVPVTGKAVRALAPFDKLMTEFIRKHHLPGAALAVAKDGRIVYSRGFGYADKDKKEPVRPESLFRIASVSKPLTAVAVLQLAERGKLKLEEPVFDFLGLKEPNGERVKFDDCWKKVTIRHLLQHRGGWDRDKSFDPMFRSPTICKEMKVEPPADPAAIIGYMLRRPLDFEPGTDYAYSNFGYCLLGRVVEKASGQGYEEYVQKGVLAPLKVERMKLGKTLLADRAENEVHYYDSGEGRFVMGPMRGKPCPEPYGAWCLESLDAHGGWIASAEDLVKFAAAFDDPAKCKVLSKKSIATMFARPEMAAKDAWYGCGWEVGDVGGDKVNTWHNGSMPGTSSLLVRRSDGLTWAVLFSSRQCENDEEPADLIDPLIHEAADAVKEWPRGR
jgi:CubicO group peptidase (beta-lactamase class C family)